MRRVQHTAFISEQTRTDFEQRILRAGPVTGPVFNLGSDGFGLRVRPFSATRRGFVCVGTITPHKNHLSILDAFERLWTDGHDVPLTFAGHIGDPQPEIEARMARLQAAGYPFSWVPDASDYDLVRLLEGARATVFASEIEGFGLPPLEGLALGLPAIVSARVPSIRAIGPLGQIRLERCDGETIRGAVLELMDDERARALTGEIAQLTLPTWDGLAAAVASWVEEGVRRGPAAGQRTSTRSGAA
jgi:glycosyltransferase involved in cell wall biosynthesis